MMFPISAFRKESLAVVKLTLENGEGKRATATGFYVKFGNTYFLVTAKHALLGLSGFSTQDYSRRSWIPRYLRSSCYRISGNILEHLGLNEGLYDQDGNQRWREHPDWDVAVIDLTDIICTDGFTPIAIDLSEVSTSVSKSGEIESVSADLDLPAVAEEVFIVGYPKGLSILPEDSLPAWKRGSIATEPHMSLNGDPIFLIDTLGREGLSGAPVLYRGNYLVGPHGLRRDRPGNPEIFRLVGVYVGREGITEGDHLSLGRVYKRSAIQDTIFYNPKNCEMSND